MGRSDNRHIKALRGLHSTQGRAVQSFKNGLCAISCALPHPLDGIHNGESWNHGNMAFPQGIHHPPDLLRRRQCPRSVVDKNEFGAPSRIEPSRNGRLPSTSTGNNNRIKPGSNEGFLEERRGLLRGRHNAAVHNA